MSIGRRLAFARHSTAMGCVGEVSRLLGILITAPTGLARRAGQQAHGRRACRRIAALGQACRPRAILVVSVNRLSAVIQGTAGFSC